MIDLNLIVIRVQRKIENEGYSWKKAIKEELEKATLKQR